MSLGFRMRGCLAVSGLCAFAFWSMPGLAQEAQEASPLASGPKIYLGDFNARLATLDTGNGTVKVIGNMGIFMTDLAFCPGGTLYGISYTKLYRVNTATAQLTLVGNTGVSDLVALTCSAAGTLLAGGMNGTHLWRIDRNTGRATSLGNTGFKAAGDLSFHEGKLYMTTTNDKLVCLNPANGAPISVVNYSMGWTPGLISIGANKLYAFTFYKSYKFLENAQGPTGGSVLVFNLTNKGIGKIGGAAFNGAFNGF